ncbi:MAG: hypothetical protein JXA25_09685 [Anaerolineales bacterium]|nr:hypothetical protein [Anaerolineales bacterium]
MENVLEKNQLHTDKKSIPEEGVSTNILVLVDQAEKAFDLTEYLEKSGFYVKRSLLHKDLLIETDQISGFDLILLHISDPTANVNEMLQFFLSQTDTPLVLITGTDHYEKAIYGLLHGLEDIIRSPYFAFEVILRIRAILHRMGRSNISAPQHGLDIETVCL